MEKNMEFNLALLFTTPSGPVYHNVMFTLTDDAWWAYCPESGIKVMGDTFRDAHDNYTHEIHGMY